MIHKIISLIICILFILGVPISFAETYNLNHDDNGNIVEGMNYEYVYNEFNQLIRVIDSGDILEEYTYDQDGSRVKKVEYLPSGTRTTYYPNKNLVRVVDSSGTKDTYYYYDDVGNLLYRKDPDGQKFYYHPDHLGSTTLITDDSGNVVEETSYLPFGEVWEGGSDRFTFTGKELDDTGLMYYGARYYDPVLKQFTQPDTLIGDIYNPQSLNRYSYVLNNPYKYTDPEGHNPLLFGMAIGGLFGTAFDMIYQIYHGASMFDGSMDWGSVGTSALIGSGAGLAGGAGWAAGGTGLLAGELAGVASGVTGQVLTNAGSGQSITENVGMAGGIGAGVGGALGVGGKLISSSLSSKGIVGSKDIVGSKHASIKPMQTKIDPQKVANFREIIRGEKDVGYIDIFDNEGYGKFIDDGHHRYVAYKLEGYPDSKIPMNVDFTKDPYRIGFKDWSRTKYERGIE